MDLCTTFRPNTVRPYTRRVGLTLTELIDLPDLGLRLLAGEDEALEREVRWCHSTELADPSPWLAGGELVLTTGLRQRTPTTQQRFVRRVAAAGASGLGFGTGLSHDVVPAATIAAAAECGLGLFDVPYATPFIALERAVADRVYEQMYGRFQTLLEMHDTLSKTLLSRRGLAGLIRALQRMVDAPVSVIDRHGAVLASSPAAAAWPVEQIVRRGADLPAGLHVRDVVVDDALIAYLCVRRATRAEDVLPYAASLVGLELARRQAVLTGRRELVGQVLEDVVRSVISPTEAERRLAAYGLDLAGAHIVVLGTVSGGADRLRNLPWDIDPFGEGGEPIVTALVGDQLTAILPPGTPVQEVAHMMNDHLAHVGAEPRVGVGGSYGGVHGLRWSFFEAREAQARGPGVNDREPLSLPGLLLASDELPLRDLGRQLLQPLIDFDERHGAGLVETLRAYLEDDGSVAQVAERFYVHRNTVRYRLNQIEKLTGRTLTSTQDRVQFWLALHAVQI